ncbi:MAG: hypothetical protein ACKO6N_03335 [Myxococcota bacterium]
MEENNKGRAEKLTSRIRQKRLQWQARQEARRALFQRKTPVASQLLWVARIRQLLARSILVLQLLVALHLAWRVSAQGLNTQLFQQLDIFIRWSLSPLYDGIQQLEPRPLPALVLSELLVMVGLLVLSRALMGLVRWVGWRRLPRGKRLQGM